jgi:hypothetical protein
LNLMMTHAQTAEEPDEGTESTFYGCGFMERHHHARGPWSELTEEQADELRELIESMREAIATPQEIHEAVAAKLEEWGYDVPPMLGPRNGEFGPWADVTEEQLDELRTMIESMRKLGAEPSEIRDAVKAMLEEWGIELPSMQGPGPRGFQAGPKPGCEGYGGRHRGRRGSGPHGSTEGFGGNGISFGKGNA